MRAGGIPTKRPTREFVKVDERARSEGPMITTLSDNKLPQIDHEAKLRNLNQSQA
jgi:hypothetical protein